MNFKKTQKLHKMKNGTKDGTHLVEKIQKRKKIKKRKQIKEEEKQIKEEEQEE